MSDDNKNLIIGLAMVAIPSLLMGTQVGSLVEKISAKKRMNHPAKGMVAEVLRDLYLKEAKKNDELKLQIKELTKEEAK